jgi:hypothetical protein
MSKARFVPTTKKADSSGFRIEIGFMADSAFGPNLFVNWNSQK